jgi:L-fuculose-phosphate aldolase
VDESDIRFRISAARRMLYREGCDSQTAGHVSVRDDDHETFWVTPFQCFDETLPEHVIRVTYDLALVEGDWEASPAIAFHAAIYRERPDVGCVVHHHGYYTSVVASTGGVVGQYNLLANLFFDDQNVIFDNEDGSAASDKRLASALGDKNVLLMKNHGCVVVGDTLEVATIKALLLEKAARYHVDCVALGGTELDDEAHVRSYGFNLAKYMLPEMWRASMRRLRKSDPELFEWAAAH